MDWKKELGKGSFGGVYAGKIKQRGIHKKCSVKIICKKGRK